MTVAFVLLSSIRASQEAGQPVSSGQTTALHTLLFEMAQKPVRAGGRAWFMIREGLREDVVQEVALRLLIDASPPLDKVRTHPELEPLFAPEASLDTMPELSHQAEAIVEGYLRAMLANKTISLIGRNRPLPPDPEPENPGVPTPVLDRELIQRTMQDLDHLTQVAAHAVRRDVDREAFQQDVCQLISLADETVSMDVLIDQALTGTALDCSDPHVRRTAAGRLHQRHTRARTRLLDTLDDPDAPVRLQPERAEIVRRAVLFYLLRRQ